MNLFSPILRLFGMGAISNPDKGEQRIGPTTIETSSGISVTDDDALKVSAFFACVQLISNSVASLPLKLYEQRGTGREIVDRHDLAKLIKRPNGTMKQRDFRIAMTAQLAMYNNAYARIFWDSRGERPIAIVPLKPGRCVPYSNGDGTLSYHYSTDKGVDIYSQKSILHLKGFGLDGTVGLSRVAYAKDALGVAASADIYAAKQFANGGNGAGSTISYDQWLTPEQRSAMSQIYEKGFETALNKNKTVVLEGGANYQTHGMTPDNLQMIQTRNYSATEICRFFGVPDILISAGDAKAAWPASFEQQMLWFLTFTIQPYLDEWEQELAYSLINFDNRRELFFDHNVDNFVKLDSKAKSELQSTWAQNGLKTRNELRAMNNDPEITGADDLTVQVNLTPIDKLGEQNVNENPDSPTDL